MSERIYGVDLGTTFSTAAWVDEHGSVVVLSPGPSATPGAKALQSAVLLRERDAVVGEDAIREARTRPDNDAFLVTGAKRYLGCDLGNIVQTSCDPIPPYIAWGEAWSPLEISALILKKLSLQVERETGAPMRRIVLTHPHFFKEGQKVATREAAELAGLEVVELMTEPSAAARACLADVEQDQRGLVFDIGGGTLDITLFEVESGKFSWSGGKGDSMLGGRDFDTALLAWLHGEWQQKNGPSYLETTKKETSLGLERAVILAKIALQESDPPAKRLLVRGHDQEGPPVDLQVGVDVELFDRCTRHLVERAREATLEALRHARGGEWRAEEVAAAMIVGGSGRLRAIQRMLQEELGLPVVLHPQLDTAVARGAALRAHELAKGAAPEAGAAPSKVARLQALDVGPPPLAHSIGVGITDQRGRYVIDWLVPEGTDLRDATAERSYATTIAGASELLVELFEGDARRLGKRPTAEPDLRLGAVQIPLGGGADGGRVGFRLSFSESGIATVRVVDPRTGKAIEASINRAPSSARAADAAGLSFDEMKKRIASTRVT